MCEGAIILNQPRTSTDTEDRAVVSTWAGASPLLTHGNGPFAAARSRSKGQCPASDRKMGRVLLFRGRGSELGQSATPACRAWGEAALALRACLKAGGIRQRGGTLLEHAPGLARRASGRHSLTRSTRSP